MRKRFESIAALVYYTLGGAHYLKLWLGGLGVLLAGSSVFLPGTRLSLAALLLGATCICVVAIAWLDYFRRRAGCLNPWLAITHLEDTYRVKADDSFEYIKTLKVRARTSGGVTEYRTKFRWSGAGSVNATVEVLASPGITLSVFRQDGLDIFDVAGVRFSRPLAKAEEIHFRLRLTMSDADHHARPFFQKYIDDDYPNGIRMRVELPRPPATVSRTVLLSGYGDVPTEVESHELAPDSGTIDWPIKRPRMGYRYRINWSSSTKTAAHSP